jgi:hypothetical protein
MRPVHSFTEIHVSGEGVLIVHDELIKQAIAKVRNSLTLGFKTANRPAS